MTSPIRKLEQSAGGLRCAAVSDVGMRRSSNQDSLAVALAESPQRWASHGHLFIVADGMGAHAAGELASKLATDNIPHSYFKRTDQSPSEAISGAVSEANDLINTKGENTVDFQGMGTTCSCLLLLPQGALAAHVGDSRVYRLRGERIEQLTFDHSLVWEMAEASNAEDDEDLAYVPKNVITRSLGPHPTVSVDLEGPFSLRAGDRFLLCSDGLTGPLTPELIGMVLSSLPPTEVAQSLIDLANLSGGPDNISAIVVEVVDPQKLGKVISTEADEPNGNDVAVGPSKVHPICWTAMAVCGILSVALAASGLTIPAIVGGVGFGMAAIVALLQKSQSYPCHSTQYQIGRRGKAPYRCHECTPNSENISLLGDIVRQLEDLESQRTWVFDWKPIQKELQHAHEAVARGDYRAGVVAYCCAVRQLMEALREMPPDDPSDSTITLA